MHPYQNTTISNTTTIIGINGEGYSDLIDHDLNQRVYVDRPIVNPIQPWIPAPNNNNSNKNQHSNYSQMYNSNNSYMMTSPSATSISTGGYISNNDTYAPPLVVGGSTSSVQSISSAAGPQSQSQNSNTIVSDNYIISNNNHHGGGDYSIQYSNNTMPPAYQTNQLEYSPSPSPPHHHHRSSSIASDSSHPSSQYQDYEEKELNNDKKNNGKAPVKKREKALERNRQAALRCRQRKKEWLNQLQSNVEELTKEKRILEQQSLSLREEILNLKTVLLAHRDCSHAHITAKSINIDNLLYRTSSTAASSSKTLP